MFKTLFVDHPASVDESYTEHLRAAGGFGVTMILTGLACLVHALIPACFVTTGSDQIHRLHERLQRRRVLAARNGTNTEVTAAPGSFEQRAV